MPTRWMDHTADVGVEIEAHDLESLFGAALVALTEIFVAEPPRASDGSRDIQLSARTLEGLLVGWLEEWIFLVQSSRRIPVDMDLDVSEHGDGWHLSATVRDAALDPKAHAWRGEVKGATYHGLEVRSTDGTWHASVVFDV